MVDVSRRAMLRRLMRSISSRYAVSYMSISEAPGDSETMGMGGMVFWVVLVGVDGVGIGIGSVMASVEEEEWMAAVVDGKEVGDVGECT